MIAIFCGVPASVAVPSISIPLKPVILGILFLMMLLSIVPCNTPLMYIPAALANPPPMNVVDGNPPIPTFPPILLREMVKN